MSILDEYKQAQAQQEQKKKDLLEKLRKTFDALPQNPEIKPILGIPSAFTISSKAVLGKPYDQRYHDWKDLYKEILKKLEGKNFEQCVTFIEESIAQKTATFKDGSKTILSKKVLKVLKDTFGIKDEDNPQIPLSKEAQEAIAIAERCIAAAPNKSYN